MAWPRTPTRSTSGWTTTFNGCYPPPGRWPRATFEATQALMLAYEQAIPRGFFGIEHLASGLSQVSSPDHPTIGQASPSLKLIAAQLGETRMLAEEPCRPPLRVQLLSTRLSAGFTPEDLLFTLARIPFLALQLPRPIVETAQARIEDETTFRRPFTPGVLHFEVEGGPDDGRLLAVAPDQYIGRWDGQESPDSVLFHKKNVIDPYVSRRHFTFLGQMRIRPHAPTTLIRNQIQEVLHLENPFLLKHGDRLVLGIGTRLQVLG